MNALQGLVVIDLTHMLSGPFGGMLLADLGARSIKVEPPGKGEGTRRLLETSPDYSKSGQGAFYMTLNRNKESVAIDLKSEEGLELFYQLVEKADIVINNFGAGVPKRLKIDFEHLSKRNPRIITCSITGFGESGPHPNRPAFDIVAQGMGGGMSLTGEEGSEPMRSGIPIGDLAGGLFGTIGVLSAVHSRSVTGRGQHVDISMFDCQLSLLNYMATMYLMSGKPPGKSGNGHFVHVPYNSFRTKTKNLIIAVITDNFWSNLVDLLGDEALRDEAFYHQPGRLVAKDFIEEHVQAAFEKETCEYWLERLAEARIPAAPVNDLEHALSDPQALARNMVVPVTLPNGETVNQPGNPIKMSDGGDESFSTPPTVGQDTRAVLKEFLDLDAERIQSLHAAGIIGGPSD